MKLLLSCLTCVGVFLVSGCASQMLQSYVGRDIQEMVMDYGPPINSFDLPNGQRAFQWHKEVAMAVSSYSSTSGSITTTTKESSKGDISFGDFSSHTHSSPGYVQTESCYYTLIARPGPRKDQWIVTSFRQPRFECE